MILVSARPAFPVVHFKLTIKARQDKLHVKGSLKSDLITYKDAGEVNFLRHHEARSCECFDLYEDLVPYKKAWFWQKAVVRMRQNLVERNEDHSDTLIILQHHPVYTLGTGSLEKFLKFDCKNAPYDLYRTERGGEVTYHGPGQLVMYPIVNLRCHKMDIHWYLRSLEEVVIRALFASLSVKASRVEGFSGVWIDVLLFGDAIVCCIRIAAVHSLHICGDDWRLSSLVAGNKKLAAVGIKVSRWITYHGLALNVTTNLAPFQHIVPCGIHDREVGSLAELLWGSLRKDVGENKALMNIIHNALLKEFSEVFQLSIQHKTIANLKFLESQMPVDL